MIKHTCFLNRNRATRRQRYRSFALDNRGAIAITFALCLPVFAFCLFGAIDFMNIYAFKRNLQHSLDAAALAAAKDYGRNPDEAYLTSVAVAYYNANIERPSQAQSDFRYGGVTRTSGETILTVSGTRTVHTFFGQLLKTVTAGQLDLIDYPITLNSEIILQNRSVEIALVLDNSGSMNSRPDAGGSPKIDALKSAATSLAQQVLGTSNGSNAAKPITIGIVPFATSVNVGADKKSAAWMDRSGLSPIHNENLDWANWKDSAGRNLALKSGNGFVLASSPSTPLSRFYVYDHGVERDGRTCQSYNSDGSCKKYSSLSNPIKMFDKGWGGCIEARPSGLAITDAEPRSNDPKTLFVPTFAPDAYDYSFESSAAGLRNNYLEEHLANPGNASEAMSAQSKVSKYFDTSYKINSSDPNNRGDGPSYGCTTKPILAMTDSKSAVTNAISNLAANGGTDIPEGLAWGWRVLSPGAPFTEGRAKDEPDNLKVIVLMTDGDNTYNLSYSNGNAFDITDYNRSLYGPFGYGVTYSGNSGSYGRIYDGTVSTIKRTDAQGYVAAMNELMTKTCANTKADGRKKDGSDGIVIFSIAFDIANGSPVKKLLEDCASYGLTDTTRKLYYDAKNNEQLNDAFAAITSEISSLRIAR